MKLDELLKEKLIEISGEKFQCLKCNKFFTKTGITNHYFFSHTDEGKLKKEEMRQAAIIKNNTPEMKKKISEGTLKSYNEGVARENHSKAIHTKVYKDNMSKIRSELWKDETYHKKQSASIRKSNTTERFRNNMSKTISSIHNAPNSTVKSKDFRLKHKEIALEQWQDPEFVEKQIESRLKSWTNKRKLWRSKETIKQWKDPNHIEKVLRGKLAYLIKNGQSPCLGKFGITDLGTIYESRFEQEIYEYLEENNYPFQAHVNLPGSSKICDIIIDGIWIELDGLNRCQFPKNSEFSWNGKDELYDYLKESGQIKDYKIFTTVVEFKNWCNDKFNLICE